ncbi:hypothetical protein D3C78_502890 [compost metagenome]
MCSAVLCVVAILVALTHYREQSVVLEQLVPQVQIQKGSIADVSLLEKKIDSQDHIALYSGRQILYGLREWLEYNVEVVVDDNVLIYGVNSGVNMPSKNQTLESILKLGVLRLELEADYFAATELNSSGKIMRIVFVKR